MYFSHSPYRAPALLPSVSQQHTNLINKSIYNALEEASIEIPAVKIFQNKQMIRQGLSTVGMMEQPWPCTKVHIFVHGFVYLTRWLLA